LAKCHYSECHCAECHGAVYRGQSLSAIYTCVFRLATKQRVFSSTGILPTAIVTSLVVCGMCLSVSVAGFGGGVFVYKMTVYK